MDIKQFLKRNTRWKRKPSTVAELAGAVGVTRQTVYNWIKGVYAPHWVHVFRLVNISEGAITRLGSKAERKTKVMFDAALTETKKEVSSHV